MSILKWDIDRINSNQKMMQFIEKNESSLDAEDWRAINNSLRI